MARCWWPAATAGAGTTRIYKPPYLQPGDCSRPAFTSPTPPRIEPADYDTWYNIGFSLPGGGTVSKVVLMRPGSTTHHSDFDQRYVELDSEVFVQVPPQSGTGVRFRTPVAPPGPSNPPDSDAAPPGWYMLFLISNCGIPSVAGWIKLEDLP